MTEPHTFSREMPEESLAGSGRVSRLALASLGLGLLSVWALAGRAFWFLPVLTMVASIAALVVIRHREGELSGRGAAWAALGLAVLFGSWAPARMISREWWITWQARQFSDYWVDLVRKGQKYEAHQLHLMQSQRKQPGETFEDYYASKQMRDRLESFFRAAPLKAISELNDRGDIRFEELDRTVRSPYTELLAIRYQLIRDTSRPDDSVPIFIDMLRSFDPTASEYRWNVGDVRLGAARQ